MRHVDAGRAAAILGIPPGAGRREIAAAFARRARATHPDRSGGDVAAFREAVLARDTLLSAADAAPPEGIRRVAIDGPRPQGAILLATWAGVLAIAAFCSVYGAEHPVHPVEAVVRWVLLASSAVAYGATGRPAFLGIALVLVAVTVVVTIVETSFGGLVGLLLVIPALYGLALSGVARARLRRAAASAPRAAEPVD